MDVNEVLLPGIGLRYEFTSAEGRRIGIVARREGNFEVVTYDRRDPDQSRLRLRLTAEEGNTVAEILGAPRIVTARCDVRLTLDTVSLSMLMSLPLVLCRGPRVVQWPCVAEETCRS